MKKNSGLITALTFVLAFLGISQLPKSAPNSATSESVTNARNPPTNPSERQNTVISYPACGQIVKRLAPFLTDILSQSRLPDSCYLSGPSGVFTVAPPGVQFAIALVPDPVTTHLPLAFDRAIEAIQQAVQDNNYSYDSSWFPWNDVSKDYIHLSDQLAAEAEQANQQLQPGVIAFRHALLTEADEQPYRGGLVIFVVSEQPTGGINSAQFKNALEWIDRFGALRTCSRKVRILGPSFSGSIPSLAAALENFNNLKPFVPGSIYISSGTVSSELAYSWFQHFLNISGLGSFQTTMEADSLTVGRFCRYISSQHYELSRLAILSEDETAFGQNMSKAPTASFCYDPVAHDGAIYLYYPRDIAALRSAYEQQSIFSYAKPPSAGGAVSNTLRGDLSEPAGSEHDTVHHYAGKMTPLAQESTLAAITNVLSDKRIQFIVLRSTNSLDQIFLARFLRKAYPSARIVIDGSDLLFRRGSEGASLHGVMVLSTYPLLTWGQDWTTPVSLQTGAYRTFGEDSANGLYVAARDLLTDPDPKRASLLPISNYAPPNWAISGDRSNDNRPPTWLSVEGHHQFWPLAVLDSQTLENEQIVPITRTLNIISPDRDPHLLTFKREFLVLIILCLLWSLLNLIWCWRGSVAPQRSMLRLAYFAPINRKQHSVLIAMGSLFPCLAVAVTAAATGLLTWDWLWWRGMLLVIFASTVVLLSVLACWKNYNLPIASVHLTANTVPSSWRRAIGSATFVIFLLFLIDRWHFVTHYTTTANRIPLYWRSIHLLSGVSPLLPQILIIFGLYLWFWFNLRGLALFGNDRPLLPELRTLPVANEVESMFLYDKGYPILTRLISLMPMFSRESAGRPVEQLAIPLGPEHLKALGVALAWATVILFLALRDGLQTLGEKRFETIILVWLTLCISIILADTLQLWRTWKTLRSLLVYLDRLPLRRTLAALKGLSWQSVWTLSGNVLEERYRLIARQFESLRHLKNRLGAWKPVDRSSEKRKNELLDRINYCQDSKGKAFADWYIRLKDEPLGDMRPLYEFQDELAATAGSVLINLLLPAWRGESQSLLFDGRQGRGNEQLHTEEEEDSAAISTPTGVPDHILAAEEFFVLPYLGFIQNILGRVRTIVLGSLFLFVAVTFAVSSYPFDPLPMLGTVFLLVFAVTGGTIILVYAQMYRDTTLSHITNTRPGELGGHFWLQLIAFGMGPLLGLLTTLFPAVTDFVTSWLQPSVQALK